MIDLVIEGRPRDLGGFSVRRVLPFAQRRMVGPFIFFDHFGPLVLPPNIPRSADVRPHPHINLATITYLFAGEILHRDSLGSVQAIRPGEVNWMTAGRGIVHSERTSPEVRVLGSELSGIQAWVALPRPQEECEPSVTGTTKTARPHRSTRRRSGALIATVAVRHRPPSHAAIGNPCAPGRSIS